MTAEGLGTFFHRDEFFCYKFKVLEFCFVLCFLSYMRNGGDDHQTYKSFERVYCNFIFTDVSTKFWYLQRGNGTHHEACTTVPSPFDGANSPGRHNRPRGRGGPSGFGGFSGKQRPGGKCIFAAAAGCTEQEPRGTNRGRDPGCTEQEPRGTSRRWDPFAAGRLSPESCERPSSTGKIVDTVFVQMIFFAFEMSVGYPQVQTNSFCWAEQYLCSFWPAPGGQCCRSVTFWYGSGCGSGSWDPYPDADLEHW